MKSGHGNELTADDVVWSWEKSMSQARTGAFIAGVCNVAKVEAVGTYTARFVLTSPSAILERALALYVPMIVDSTEAKEHATGADPYATSWLARNAAGFGPYVIESWSPATAMTLTANENYYGGKPFFKKIVINQVPDPSTRVSLLTTGQVDYADQLTFRQLDTVAASSAAKVVSIPTGNISEQAEMNVTFTPFDSVTVRQAMNYAIDQRAILQAVFENRSQAARSVLPPSVPGYDPGFYPYSYDPAKARQLLAQAGHSSGIEVTLNYSSLTPGTRSRWRRRPPESRTARPTATRSSPSWSRRPTQRLTRSPASACSPRPSSCLCRIRRGCSASTRVPRRQWRAASAAGSGTRTTCRTSRASGAPEAMATVTRHTGGGAGRAGRMRALGRYVLMRILILIPLLLGVSLVAFFLLRVGSSSPAALIAGPGATPKQLAQINHQLGLDRPVLSQYLTYISRVLHGNFGVSWVSSQGVLGELWGRLGVTLILVGAALLVSVVFGVSLGYAAALRGGLADQSIRIVTTAGISMPIFWTGVLFIYVFFTRLRWAPPPLGQSFANYILPVAVLALAGASGLAKQSRAAVLETRGSRAVRFARACGLPPRQVGWLILRCSLPSIITYTGITAGLMMGGSSLIELIFSLPGIAQLGLESVSRVDYSVVQGYVLLIGVLMAVVYLITDVAVALADPRITYR